MKTPLPILTLILAATVIRAATLELAQPPESTEGRDIAFVKDNQVANPPKWLQRCFINSTDAILVGDNESLPFDQLSVSIFFYNRYNILLKYSRIFTLSRETGHFWTKSSDLIAVPTKEIFGESDLAPLPDDFDTIAWTAIETKNVTPRVIRRALPE